MQMRTRRSSGKSDKTDNFSSFSGGRPVAGVGPSQTIDFYRIPTKKQVFQGVL